MTEFNYLIYCPVCDTETNFLGGTSEAICMDCEGVITNPIIHERLTLDAIKRAKLDQRSATTKPLVETVVVTADEIDPLLFDNNARIARDNREGEILSMLFGLKAEYDKKYRFAKDMYKTAGDRWKAKELRDMKKFWKGQYVSALEMEDAIEVAIETAMGIEEHGLDKALR